jgi:AcrR family transcriptional regulator
VNGGDLSTRAKMLDAAVQCIVEEGFYRASSNRIAARAGVSWGVIQHYFGTREKLLLEVVRESADELVTWLPTLTVAGESTEDKLRAFIDIVFTHYRQPTFAASLQIFTNLGKDPRTTDDTRAALLDAEVRASGLWRQLVDQTFPPGSFPDGLGPRIFALIRIAAIGMATIDEMPHMTAYPVDEPGYECRAVLEEAVLLLTRAHLKG